MIRPMTAVFLAGAAMALPMAATPASAQEAMAGHEHAACTAPAPLPAELAGWGTPHRPLKAAVKSSGAAKALLVQGTAFDTTLVRTPEVEYVLEPGKPGGSVSFGGLFAFDVAQAGRYRVAQDGRSWVDVIVDGKAVTSAAHGHGPECSGVTKMVEYDLPAGRHLLQIAANGEAALTVMVAAVQ